MDKSTIFAIIMVMASIGIGWYSHKIVTTNTILEQTRLEQTKGYWAVVTNTGSMLPCIDTKDDIYLQYVDENTTLSQGDTVSYYSSENNRTFHRIIYSINTSNYPNTVLYVLKGDNNAYPDPKPVLRQQVYAKLNATSYG